MSKIKFTANLQTPCKDCARRVVGCHSTCEEYATYRQELAEMKEKIDQAKSFEKEYMAIRYGTVSRMSKSERDARFKKLKQR